MEADLAAREVEARDLEHKLARIRDAMRDQLYPLTPLREVKFSTVAALAGEAEGLQDKYLRLLGQINGLQMALGK
jgi:hypothetical protein